MVVTCRDSKSHPGVGTGGRFGDSHAQERRPDQSAPRGFPGAPVRIRSTCPVVVRPYPAPSKHPPGTAATDLSQSASDMSTSADKCPALGGIADVRQPDWDDR